jgi:hypothetical protein
MGLGRTVRMQVEFCLIAIKGNPIINGISRGILLQNLEGSTQESQKLFTKWLKECA